MNWCGKRITCTSQYVASSHQDGARWQNEQAEPAAAACAFDLEKGLFSGSCSLISEVTEFILH